MLEETPSGNLNVLRPAKVRADHELSRTTCSMRTRRSARISMWFRVIIDALVSPPVPCAASPIPSDQGTRMQRELDVEAVTNDLATLRNEFDEEFEVPLSLTSEPQGKAAQLLLHSLSKLKEGVLPGLKAETQLLDRTTADLFLATEIPQNLGAVLRAAHEYSEVGFNAIAHRGPLVALSTGRTLFELGVRCLWAALEADGWLRLAADEVEQWEKTTRLLRDAAPKDEKAILAGELKRSTELKEALSRALAPAPPPLPSLEQIVRAISKRGHGIRAAHYDAYYRQACVAVHGRLVGLRISDQEGSLLVAVACHLLGAFAVVRSLRESVKPGVLNSLAAVDGRLEQLCRDYCWGVD